MSIPSTMTAVLLTGHGGFDATDTDDSAWSGAALSFSRIQGAACCGETVQAQTDFLAKEHLGKLVLIPPQ